MGLLLWGEACPEMDDREAHGRGEAMGTVLANVQSAGQVVKAAAAPACLTF
jgi:hypothetical protein